MKDRDGNIFYTDKKNLHIFLKEDTYHNTDFHEHQAYEIFFALNSVCHMKLEQSDNNST